MHFVLVVLGGILLKNQEEYNQMRYLEIWEVFRHEAVDLTDRQTSCFTVHQCHEDQGAAAT